jgi:hypothetical protein
VKKPAGRVSTSSMNWYLAAASGSISFPRLIQSVSTSLAFGACSRRSAINRYA